MFTLYWIAVAPGMKTIPAELLLTHKKTEIAVRFFASERSCAPHILNESESSQIE